MSSVKEDKVTEKSSLSSFWKHPGDEFWNMKGNSKSDENTFHNADAKSVRLRGESYMKDNIKVPSGDAAYTLICSKCFATTNKMVNVAEEVQSLKDALSSNLDEEYLVICWLVPAHITVINLYIRTLKQGKDRAFDRVHEMFRKGDSKFRDSRFKLIPQVLGAPMAIRALVNSLLGGLRPVIIGNKLQCHHFSGRNYMEVDIDTGSSSIVSYLARTMVSAFKDITVNQGFVIEGRSKRELPERMLGIHCYTRVSLDTVKIKYDDQRCQQKRRWSIFGDRKRDTDTHK
mmetsp:Transcript_20019/g.31793  ORF Transcript_20019/g.31793 Transcript_20019/m.31793 type:complete len:287 (+) Transcript_20019:141-1001(+)|eukprot:jgi/Bigna1/87233/estExt_fgenesh1_pg.C_180040